MISNALRSLIAWTRGQHRYGNHTTDLLAKATGAADGVHHLAQ
jgi:hypothetical protein